MEVTTRCIKLPTEYVTMTSVIYCRSVSDKRDQRCALTIKQEQSLCRLYRSGLTAEQLAKRFHCSARTVLYIMSIYKEPVRPQGPVRQTEAVKKVIARTSRERWQNKKYRARQLPRLRQVGFRPGRSPREPRVISIVAYRELRRRVFKRDRGSCRLCKAKGTDIHHMKPWKTHPELRYIVDNCITLCRPCHMSVEARVKRGYNDFRDVLPIRIRS